MTVPLAASPASPTSAAGIETPTRRRRIRSVDGAIARFTIAAAAGLILTALLPRLVPVDPIPILAAAAAFCVAALARRRSPSSAWLAAIGGAFAATLVPIAQARVADPATLGVDRWWPWAAVAGTSAIVTIWVAADYATRPGHRLDPVSVPIAGGLLGWFIVAIAVTIGAIVGGGGSDPAFNWIDVAVAPIAGFSLFVLVLVALGAAADVRAAARRADLGGAPGSAEADVAARPAFGLIAATVRELLPGAAAAEEARLEAERQRLAGDLHASVLPSLRRAIADAEDGGDPALLAQRLRHVDLELERLMADRWPVVLETFGLVQALEDLAERLEADGSPPITIDVERADGRPPAAIERAAWRFLQVTLDNAIRHGAAGSIHVRVGVAAKTVHLAVADDGRGLHRETPARPGGRGLADAARRAADAGATATIEGRPEGGTEARFRWSAARRDG